MTDTQQKIKQQYKNIAVAIVTNEDGKVLLTKVSDNGFQSAERDQDWDFPSNVIIPGATYTETFASDVLERSGCIVEATALVSSEKIHTLFLHYEYVECKIVCRDTKFKKSTRNYKWVHPTKLKKYFVGSFNKDLSEFLDL